jgi:hypothetical protein
MSDGCTNHGQGHDGSDGDRYWEEDGSGELHDEDDGRVVIQEEETRRGRSTSGVKPGKGE